MGVNLRDLFPQHPVPDGWYQGKRIAVDGHNVAWRYLTSFRQPNGDVLRAPDGRVIAHLIGFTNLVRHLRERGAEPIVVWDGKVHERKWATVRGRIEVRKASVLEEQTTREEIAQATAMGDAAFGELVRLDLQLELDALAPGDAKAAALATMLLADPLTLARRRRAELQETLHKHMRAATYLDGKMIEDCSRVLEAVGVAVVHAENDGERHATALCHAGHADAVATEDFDALVAGAPFVLRKAGSPEPFLHKLDDMSQHGLTQAQLRQIAILCGTDWHPGVKGFGAKTALKALKEAPDLRALWGPGSTRYHLLVQKHLAEAGESALVVISSSAATAVVAMPERDIDGEPAPLTLALFEDLEAYIASLPIPASAPRRTRPSPELAAELAKEMGISPQRLLACFC